MEVMLNILLVGGPFGKYLCCNYNGNKNVEIHAGKKKKKPQYGRVKC